MKRLKLLFKTIRWILIVFLFLFLYTKIKYIYKKGIENTDIIAQEFNIREIDFYKNIKVNVVPEDSVLIEDKNLDIKEVKEEKNKNGA